jgi:hypothetical protein
MKDEFGHVKEMYRSKLLNTYTRSEFTDGDVTELISEYTQLRFKDLMLNTKFRESIQGPHSTYYLRMLREEIARELELTEEIEEPHELEYEHFEEKNLMMYDAESIHNMAEFSNTEAVGFDNLEQRAEDPSQNRNLAHKTLFDKLLSEYFTQKRQQVVNINELMDKVSSKFGAETEERVLRL